jgi:hypothetical protein
VTIDTPVERCEAFLAHLRSSPRLTSRSEFFSANNPVPEADGIYGIFVDDVLPGIDTSKCLCVDGRVLVYVGAGRGRPSSKRSSMLRGRFEDHFTNIAEFSTVRFSLGVLLANQIGTELRFTGTDTMVFANGGERRLDEWMERHFHLTWLPVEKPWEVEKVVLKSDLCLPLNISGHRGRGSPVKAARGAARDRADALSRIQGDRGR